MLHDLVRDLRASLRQLRRTPGFTLGAVTVLALGLGLNAAVFGLFHGLAFASRPFAQADQLVQLYSRHASDPDSYRAFSHGAYEVIAGRSDVFTGVIAHNLDLIGLRDASTGQPRRTFAAFVSANYFEVLGVPVAQGRAFTSDEARPGSAVPVAIASHVLWRRLGQDPALVGRTVWVNEQPVTIVGIAPRGFSGTMMAFGPELFLPIGLHDELGSDLERVHQSLSHPSAFALFLVGRLAPGLDPKSGTARLGATSTALAEAYPVQYRDYELSVAPLPRFGTSTSPSDESAVTMVAAVFLGLTAAVLLIVCLNLASVVIARAETRRREFAIRLALGGGRARIIRQLMVEALVLGVAGAAGGVLLALPAIDAFLTTLVSRFPISLAIDVGTTPGTVTGGLAFGVLAALLFALGPALRQTRADGMSDLKHQLGDDAPTRRRWVRAPLVTAQVALSLALLVAAGLLVRFAREGTAVDVGMDADQTILVDLDAALGGLEEARALPLYADIEARVKAMPDVEAAAIGVTVPFGAVSFGESVRRAGTHPAKGARPATPEAGRSFGATSNAVTPGYPQAMGMRLLRGRTFTDAEALRAGAPRVALVDEALARKLWPDGDALGQAVHIGDDEDTPGEPPVAVTIVGITGAVAGHAFEQPEGTVFVPFAQRYRSAVYLHVRPRSGAAPALVDRVRQVVRDAGPSLPVFGATTFGAHLRSSLEFWGLRSLASVAMSVGAFAALIALVGVYGANAYAVSRRAREIGVRLAVGASPASVRRMILGEALHVGVVGVAIGSLLGLGVGQALAATFVAMASVDLWSSALAASALVVACGMAAWVPARRAAGLDPASVLRSE